MNPPVTSRALTKEEAEKLGPTALGRMTLEYEPIPEGPRLTHPPAGQKPKRDERGHFIYPGDEQADAK